MSNSGQVRWSTVELYAEVTLQRGERASAGGFEKRTNGMFLRPAPMQLQGKWMSVRRRASEFSPIRFQSLLGHLSLKAACDANGSNPASEMWDKAASQAISTAGSISFQITA